jgi:hypothetical protein
VSAAEIENVQVLVSVSEGPAAISYDRVFYSILPVYTLIGCRLLRVRPFSRGSLTNPHDRTTDGERGRPSKSG